MPTFNLIAMAYHAAYFLTVLALAAMLATGIYRLVEVPGRRGHTHRGRLLARNGRSDADRAATA